MEEAAERLRQDGYVDSSPGYEGGLALAGPASDPVVKVSIRTAGEGIENYEQTMYICATLGDVALRGELIGADCKRAQQGDTNLADGALSNCDLTDTNLPGADLTGANLRRLPTSPAPVSLVPTSRAPP